MKKILPIITLSALFLGSCSIDWNDENAQLKAQIASRGLEMQEKCSKRMEELFEKWTLVVTPEVFFTQHYNERLNKCLLRKESKSNDKSGTYIYTQISDMYDNNEFGSYFANISWHELSACYVQEISCSSRSEFNNLADKLMSE